MHLLILYGGVVVGGSPLMGFFGTLGYTQAALVLLGMLPAIYLTAKTWHLFKMKRPHAASMVLVFLGVAFAWEFVTRPW